MILLRCLLQSEARTITSCLGSPFDAIAAGASAMEMRVACRVVVDLFEGVVAWRCMYDVCVCEAHCTTVESRTNTTYEHGVCTGTRVEHSKSSLRARARGSF